MYMYVWPHVLLCRIKQLHVCTEFKFILYLIICTGTILYNYRYNLFICTNYFLDVTHVLHVHAPLHAPEHPQTSQSKGYLELS